MLLSFSALGLGATICVIYAVASFILRKYANARRLPPGPPGLPLLGNINDMPKPGGFEAHHWLKHKDLYGPISSLTVLGKTTIIINDPQIALELLEKRSAKYSDRPVQTFAGEMCGWDQTLGLLQNDSRLRATRKKMTRGIGPTSASHFNEKQEAEVGHFLLNLLDQPDDLLSLIRREAGTLILRVAYGYHAESHKEDTLIKMASSTMKKFDLSARPGVYLVDVLPLLKYVPSWLPGAGFKRTAQEWYNELMDTIELPYNFVKRQMAEGQNERSFLSELFEAGEPDPEVVFENKLTASTMYMSGSDTTVSAIMTFFLAMTICPNAQRKGQEEIDSIIGSERLPTISDRSDLPYIDAIMKEVLRWAPITPMGLPHAAQEDDEIEGYHIPNGAMLLANVWHFLRDPNVYQEPSIFNPDRFLKTDNHIPEPDPQVYAFGFGRRVCPGRHMAENALYLNIAQTLAVFNISKKVRNGHEIDPVIEFESGVLSHPVPFENNIKPRSLKHEQLIKSIEVAHPWQTSDADIMQDLIIQKQAGKI